MRWLAASFLVLLLLLQYRVWLSPDGVREVLRLQQAVAQQQDANAQLLERNRQLGAEVRDLKQGYAALEERARSDLGMISGNETFYQVVPSSAPAPSPVPPAYRSPASAAPGKAPLEAAAEPGTPPPALPDSLRQHGAAARE